MPNFDPTRYRYPSRRGVVYARRAMACTSVPLGAGIGLDVMKAGGNAVDAAVAMAAAMPLLEPTGNALGSDCFALVWMAREKRLYGLNASGVSPRALSLDTLKTLGFDAMPQLGWLPTMVPGAAAGWAELNRRFGAKPLAELFAPAVSYAREGVPVPVTVAEQWRRGAARFREACEREPALHGPWRAAFLREDGAAYGPGELFRFPALADTLEELAATGCESLYRGDLMRKIVAFSRETGGFFSESDFTEYRPEWVEPISVEYKGYTVCEMPPNGHGITVLMALNILKGLKLGKKKDSAETWHLIMEAIKLAFADTMRYVADPRFMRARVADLLSEDYAARRRALIGEQALEPSPGNPASGGTIYLCTADQEGNMVSLIQSNYQGFGAGVLIPGTGISLQNRGMNFSLDPTSDNALAGGKKSYHTIIPGFLLRDGEAVGPFGVMGAFMQPQGHVQVLVNAIDYHMNPQECLDAPRMQWIGGKRLQAERGIPPETVAELSAMGHEIEVTDDSLNMGRGQIIWRGPDGLYTGATEPRCDGAVAAW